MLLSWTISCCENWFLKIYILNEFTEFYALFVACWIVAYLIDFLGLQTKVV